MTFYYISTRTGEQKTLPADVVSEMREHLMTGFSLRLRLGELQDIMLEFRQKNGQRLLIHQLEPMFTYVAMYDHLWPEDSDGTGT